MRRRVRLIAVTLASASPSSTVERQAWLVPALLFSAVVAYLLVAEHGLLAHVVLPTGDNAADDLLVQDAKRLHLLHGNYSRFGFYHPGPWFLYVRAAGEYVFRPRTGFRSHLGAQTFAVSLTHGAAFALTCRLWLLATRRADLAVLATLVVAAAILAPIAPVNPFLRPWTPYAIVAASLLAATGLAGTLLRGPSWLPCLRWAAPR